MGVAIVTGSAGLIGAAAVRRFAAEGLDIVGIDNDMRRYFFGDAASTATSRDELVRIAFAAGLTALFSARGAVIRLLKFMQKDGLRQSR